MIVRIVKLKFQNDKINDFKEFSGFNPSTYFSGEAEGTAWRDNEMS